MRLLCCFSHSFCCLKGKKYCRIALSFGAKNRILSETWIWRLSLIPVVCLIGSLFSLFLRNVFLWNFLDTLHLIPTSTLMFGEKNMHSTTWHDDISGHSFCWRDHQSTTLIELAFSHRDIQVGMAAGDLRPLKFRRSSLQELFFSGALQDATEPPAFSRLCSRHCPCAPTSFSNWSKSMLINRQIHLNFSYKYVIQMSLTFLIIYSVYSLLVEIPSK